MYVTCDGVCVTHSIGVHVEIILVVYMWRLSCLSATAQIVQDLCNSCVNTQMDIIHSRTINTICVEVNRKVKVV